MVAEKRRFARIPFGVKAEMKANDVLYCVDGINNLSVGGCLLPITIDLKPGTTCRIRILLSGTSSELSVSVNGSIVRCEHEATGIKFTHIDPDSLFHLQNIIRYNSLDPEAVEREFQEHPSLV